MKDLNIRLETIKLLEENIGDTLLEIVFGVKSKLSSPRPKAKEAKNKQVGLHQTKNLLYSKGNRQQNEKATYQMEENICKSYI